MAEEYKPGRKEKRFMEEISIETRDEMAFRTSVPSGWQRPFQVLKVAETEPGKTSARK